MAKKELTDEQKRLLKQLVDHYDDEDRSVRERQIRVWRRLKMLWENMQHVYYSEVAHDWRVPESSIDSSTDQGYYDKPVNIYRAYLESIIAALSVTVPPITCYPDDADNSLDVVTAKAGDKIAELIFRHNDAPLLWIHALFIFCTEGMISCYSYPKADDSYGTYEENEYEHDTEMHEYSVCPLCGVNISDKIVSNQQRDEFQPDDDDAFANSFLNEGMDYCEQCAQMVNPNRETSPLIVERIVGKTHKAKSRVCMEVYGGLFVKIPIWARNQGECNYLIYSYETHYSNALEIYPELKEKIGGGTRTSTSTGSYELYEQWGRLSPQYQGEYPINNVTIRNCWFKPAAFNILQDDEAKELKKQYPNGVKVVMINDCVAHACNEDMDDCWTLTYNPLSDYIHFDPLGMLLVSVQDITNDLVSLVLQTIEHGIPQTFADPKVLNFNSYRNSEVIPGGIYPATPKSGKALSEGFYDVKTATLSQEVLPFATEIQNIGQLVSGALPSLFGGQMAGSRTASEYSMSRAQALQRLQTNWKMLTMWWKNVFSKAIPMYIKIMKDDEHQVKKDELGNFVNVFIRRAELEGKIGSVELEANENLPITWNQQKDTVMQLLENQNPAIQNMMLAPENVAWFKRAVGLVDFAVPDLDDRNKQNEEINLLITSEPIMVPPQPTGDPMLDMQAMPIEVPSVDIDFDVDNHELEAELCRRWLISDAGRQTKAENQAGYKNVLLHMKAHKDAALMKLMQDQQRMMMAQGGPMGSPSQPGPTQPQPPIQEESNVPVTA